jgi:hypothetical protein
MSHRNPVTIQVSRQEIDRCNTSGVSIILESFVPYLLERNRNRVQIKVCGFGNDKRELFDIPEVRKYFRKLFDDNPGLFYWIDINSYMFVFLSLMLFEPYRVNAQVTLTPQDLQSYLVAGFLGLNEFCRVSGASPEKTNASISAWLRGAYEAVM